MTLRIGTGFDVHALVAGRPLVLGGVTIPHSHGLAGHSDADVLLHAIADALLGALALGDLGAHFPDSDARYKDADSRVLLRHVVTLVSARGYGIGNVDATVIAQAPKIAPFVAAMRANVASDLRCDIDRVSIKATTTERLGFTGRGEGIAAEAVVLVVPHEVNPSAVGSNGSSTRATVPPPSRGTRSNVPPCRRAIRSTIASPSPAPAAPSARVRASVARVKGCFKRSTSLCRDPGTAIGDLDACHPLAHRGRDLDRRCAVRERVVDEVRQPFATRPSA